MPLSSGPTALLHLEHLNGDRARQLRRTQPSAQPASAEVSGISGNAASVGKT